MNIGDVSPMPEGTDYDAVRRVMYCRRFNKGALKKTAKWRLQNGGRGRHPSAVALTRTVDQTQASIGRLVDPFEQARTYLRKKGFIPVAEVDGLHHVGRLRFETKGEVIEYATQRGWQE